MDEVVCGVSKEGRQKGNGEALGESDAVIPYPTSPSHIRVGYAEPRSLIADYLLFPS